MFPFRDNMIFQELSLNSCIWNSHQGEFLPRNVCFHLVPELLNLILMNFGFKRDIHLLSTREFRYLFCYMLNNHLSQIWTAYVALYVHGFRFQKYYAVDNFVKQRLNHSFRNFHWKSEYLNIRPCRSIRWGILSNVNVSLTNISEH